MRPFNEPLVKYKEEPWGLVPVQATGWILGWGFYFRARGSHWEVSIGELTQIAVGIWYVENPLWVLRVKYSDGQFDAGYMTKEEAEKFIRQAALAYGMYCRATL